MLYTFEIFPGEIQYLNIYVMCDMASFIPSNEMLNITFLPNYILLDPT